jgi:drug/metabolite transporter (DMT)-like permease
VVAILGGFGAACAWAIGTLCSTRAARLIDSASVLAWVMLVGLVLALPFVILAGIPDGLDAGSGGWLALGGAGNGLGLFLAYTALRLGKVSIVAPLVSAEGAVAALLALAFGEHLSGGQLAALAAVAVGIGLAGAARGAESRNDRAAALLAVTAACVFGVGLYSTGRASNEVSVAWAMLPPRVVGVLFVALPLIVLGRLAVTRAALPFVAASGVCEVAGFASYAAGARDSIAVAGVLASQFAALAAIAAFVLFHERPRRLQLVGITLLAAGVGAVSALRA